ncbi:lipid A deacylase LpxR family protein [Chitinophaga sp. Cy-1792]|uniref:lipid A deacylase LpxR family protein n=1 Tax=Chitinophaga sp. Cy-1792 TaxID=2608339 RepID=UPI0014209414|nr:lipid A deacylase LpxR family protein [Chitinophaga sp. Cy-1792]NIG52259.1 lipid A deacylase LpxR family protein [Chitinophaga sp. Cy-1792]
MKHSLICFILCILSLTSTAQITQNATSILKLNEIDDYFNLWGRGTDRAYTNGSCIGYLYMKKKDDRFLDKWVMPKAGKSAINVWDWSLMEMMMTPNNLEDSNYIPNDFYYAGSFFAIHGLTSYNPQKKYSLHSEIVFGFMGPWALGGELQKMMHSALGDEKPQGWGNQLPNAPLLNYNFTFQRMLWNPKKYLEIVGAATAQGGTMIDGLNAMATIRVGLFNPYFGDEDLQKATRHKFQVYAFFNPTASYVMYNALLQGGLFRSQSQQFREQSAAQVTRMNPFIAGYDYGVGFVVNRCSFIYSQQTATAWMSGTGKHSVGNIMVLIALSKRPVPSPSSGQ